MDPKAVLAIIESETASYADRLDAVVALGDWLDAGGFAPETAPFLRNSRDVKALWKGLRSPSVRDGHSL